MDIQEKGLWIYHSNRLAEITLSKQQTIELIENLHLDLEEEFQAPDGVYFPSSVVTNHLKALNYVFTFPIHKKLHISTIQQIHSRLMEGEILSYGEFRECNMRLVGIQPYPYQKISQALEELCHIIHFAQENPPEDKEGFAWKVHHEFSLIHPFVDGNGRMARLMYLLVCLVLGLKPKIISSEDKKYYLRSIQDYQKYKLKKHKTPLVNKEK